jgi:hypothetical protein
MLGGGCHLLRVRQVSPPDQKEYRGDAKRNKIWPLLDGQFFKFSFYIKVVGEAGLEPAKA